MRHLTYFHFPKCIKTSIMIQVSCSDLQYKFNQESKLVAIFEPTLECWHGEKCIILRNMKLNNFLWILSFARWLISPYDRTPARNYTFASMQVNRAKEFLTVTLAINLCHSKERKHFSRTHLISTSRIWICSVTN